MAKTKKHQINPAMHYTVVIALIISLVTTFLLGVLLTETLFGGGLGYFSDVRHEAQVNKKKVDIMRSIQGQINSQISVDGASAKTRLGGKNLPGDFQQKPGPSPDSTYVFGSGVINQGYQPGYEIGSNFSFLFNSPENIDLDSRENVGRYRVNDGYRLVVGENVYDGMNLWDGFGLEVSVHNDVQRPDGVRDYVYFNFDNLWDEERNISLGPVNVYLFDEDASMLSGDELPNAIDLNNMFVKRMTASFYDLDTQELFSASGLIGKLNWIVTPSS